MIGDQLRQAREAQPLTVAEAANLLKVKRQTLYNYENGKWLPKMRVLVAASAAWNWPFEVSGCKLVPEELKRTPAKKRAAVQMVFPFERARVYRGAVVRIRPRNGELVITAIARVATKA